MSSSNCCFLTCIQISQEPGQVVWYSHLLMNFPQFVVIHTVKVFCIVNKAEVNVYLELSCFINPTVVGNLISGSSAFPKSNLNILNFMVHILLKPGLENFEHYFASMCICTVQRPFTFSICYSAWFFVVQATIFLTGVFWMSLAQGYSYFSSYESELLSDCGDWSRIGLDL